MRRIALLTLVLPFLLVTAGRAQDAQPAAAPPPAGHAHAMGPSMGGGSCGDGECACKAMMARMDSANARLAALTETMDKASGSKKTEAMAAVVDALVQDRLAMQGMMKQMHEHMMHMMMGGGEMGGMGGMGGMMHPKPDCPAGQACGAAAAPAPKE